MKMKKMLKGIVRLMLALVVTCGVGLVLFQVDAMATPSLAAGSDEGSAQVLQETTDSIAKVEFLVNGVVVKTVENPEAGSPIPLTTADIISGWKSSISRESDGTGVITAKVTPTSGPKMELDTPSLKTNPVYKVSVAKADGVKSVVIDSINDSSKGKKIDEDAFVYGSAIVNCKAEATSTAIKAWALSAEKAKVTLAANNTEAKVEDITGDITLTPSASSYTLKIKNDAGTEVTNVLSVAANNTDASFTPEVLDGTDPVTGLTYTWTFAPATTAGVTLTPSTTSGKLTVKANNVAAKITAKLTVKQGDKVIIPETTYEINTTVQAIAKVVLYDSGNNPINDGGALAKLATSGEVSKYTIKAFADAEGKVDITSTITAFSATSSNTDISTKVENGILSVWTTKGGKKADITVSVTNPSSATAKTAKFTAASDGFYVKIDASATSAEPGKSITFSALTDPSDYPKPITYKWYVDGKLAKTASSFKKAFSKSNTYTITLEATDGTNYSTDSMTVSISYDDKITIPSTIMLTVGEQTSFTATCTNNLFEDADSDEFELIFDMDNYEKYIDVNKIKVSSIAKNGSSAVLSMVGKETYTADKKNTMTLDFGGVESNTAVVYVFKKPQITQSTTSGTTPNIKFNVPTYVGTAVTNNMTVTGYRVKIYKGDNLVKTTDIKDGTGDGKTLNIADIMGDIASVAGDGDSFTFKLAIQPVGKINNTGDVVDAKTRNSSNEEVDYVSDKSSEFTIYRLKLTADPGITTAAATGWGFPGQTTEIKATGTVGYWTKNGAKIDGSDAKQSYTHTFSATTAENSIGAVLGATVPSTPAAGGTGSTAGLDDVPKTSESNAPIWLIVVLVFAAMGGGYALYLQMKPATVTSTKKSPFTQDGYDDYDDNF